jgi:hypothetical protein
MDGIGPHWRSAAERARGDLFLMIAMCDVVCSSSHASTEQLIVAKSARQSLLTVRRGGSELQIEVATRRYQKLVDLLILPAADASGRPLLDASRQVPHWQDNDETSIVSPSHPTP